MLEWLLLLIIGVATGAYGVLVGAGGGFILSPILLSFFGMPPAMVAGTSLALVSINSISGAYAYRKMGMVDVRSGLLFALAAIPGSVIAPFFISKVSIGSFQILLAILLLLVSIQIAWRDIISRIVGRVFTRVKATGSVPVASKEKVGARRGFRKASREISSKDGRVYKYSFNEPAATIFNFVLGFMSSFFGTGGGFLRTPILVNVFGFPVQVAAATSIFALAFYTTAGSVSHVVFGNVQWWPTFAFAGIGLLIGGQIGARLSGKISSVWILRMLLIVLVALAIRLLLQAFVGG